MNVSQQIVYTKADVITIRYVHVRTCACPCPYARPVPVSVDADQLTFDICNYAFVSILASISKSIKRSLDAINLSYGLTNKTFPLGQPWLRKSKTETKTRLNTQVDRTYYMENANLHIVLHILHIYSKLEHIA